MIKIMTEKNISSSVLRCFFQYVLMFKKLEKKYNNIFIKYQKFYLEKNYNKLLKSEEEIDIMKEILELLILFLYSDNELTPELKKGFETYIKKLNNLILLNLFDNKNNYTFINKDLLIRDLKLYNLFDKIVDIIFLESNFLFYEEKYLILSEILRNKIIKQMKEDFFSLYLKLDKEIKQKIKKIFINELNISNYIDINTLLSSIRSDFNSMNKEYETISVFFALKEKIFSKNFINDLESNFGIYLNSESFIECLKSKKANYLDIKNLLIKYDLISIMNIIKLKSFGNCENNNDNDSNNGFIKYYYNDYTQCNKYPYIIILQLKKDKFFIIPKKIQSLINKEKDKFISILVKKRSKRDNITFKNKDKIKKSRIIIKNSYKNNNHRFNNYTNKKNNKRLLLFKRNNY